MIEEATPGCRVTNEYPVAEQAAFKAADDAWSAALEKAFGKRAGDVRYTPKGHEGPVLGPLHAKFARTRDAWFKAMEVYRALPQPSGYYEEAMRVAAALGCRVAIVRNDNDGPGRHWDWVAEAKGGGFPSAAGRTIHDIIEPPSASTDSEILAPPQAISDRTSS